MTAEQRILEALRSADTPAALRELVANLARDGLQKAAIAKSFEDFVVQHRNGKDLPEGHEDVIFDLLDGLEGWCHPTARILTEKN